MKIIIETIPHATQRYDTCGDWQWLPKFVYSDELLIRVSKTGNWKEEILVAVHELVEAILCRSDDIPELEVDEFDNARGTDGRFLYEEDGFDEPGLHPDAPYHDQHVFADSIERLLALMLKVNWQNYERHLSQLKTPGDEPPPPG